MSGWICLHRKLTDWEWYTDANTMRLFIHCLIKANHKDKKWRGIDIKRGQFITSRDSLSKELKLSVMQIRTSLNKLKSTSDITIKTSNKNTLISITNYETYQSNNQQDNSEITIKQPASNHQITTTNNDNNETNKQENTLIDCDQVESLTDKKTKETKANNVHKIPTIEQVRKYAAEQGYTCDPDQFFYYWDSIDWKRKTGQKIKNWKSALTQWEKNHVRFNPVKEDKPKPRKSALEGL